MNSERQKPSERKEQEWRVWWWFLTAVAFVFSPVDALISWFHPSNDGRSWWPTQREKSKHSN